MNLDLHMKCSVLPGKSHAAVWFRFQLCVHNYALACACVHVVVCVSVCVCAVMFHAYVWHVIGVAQLYSADKLKVGSQYTVQCTNAADTKESPKSLFTRNWSSFYPPHTCIHSMCSGMFSLEFQAWRTELGFTSIYHTCMCCTCTLHTMHRWAPHLESSSCFKLRLQSSWTTGTPPFRPPSTVW